MSMSTHVAGFRPADDKWNQMKSVWDSCTTAGVEPPKAVLEFFQHEYPGDKPGIEINIMHAIQKWSDNYREGYELDVSKLPQDCRFVRFYNAY